MSNLDSGTTPDGAAQTEQSTGTDEIGELNFPKAKVQEEAQKEQQPEQKPAEVQTTESQSKEERHFSKKINEMNESRMSFAKRLIEKDRDSIYDIADEDPKLAEKMLKEFDFEVESLDELMELRNNPKADKEAVKKRVEDNTRMSKLEQELFDEKLLRLKGEHADLDDELEEEYKKVYSNEAFEGKSEAQMLNIARASLGKEPVVKKVDKAALEILKAQEGFTSSPKQSNFEENKKVIPASERQALSQGGVTDEDYAKYLPDNFDEMYTVAYSGINNE